MKLVDTHCHLNFESYDEDRVAVLKRATDAGVTQVINPGTDIENSQGALKLASQYEGVFAAVGIHPNSIGGLTQEKLDTLESLAARPKVVAIGEIGLDYYWEKETHEDQIEAFEKQLQLAAYLQLPVIIHNRDASHNIVPILEEWAAGLNGPIKERPGVLHSFSASAETAERMVAAGFYLGFTGPITYKNSDKLRKIAADVPLDRILVETDGPFLSPQSRRGKRNEPGNIPEIIDRLAGLHQIGAEQMAEHTTANAERLFRLSSR